MPRVTEVRVHVLPPREDRLAARVSVTFDGCFTVRDIRLIRGTPEQPGWMLAMPHRATDDGPRDVAHPITPAFRAELTAAVVRAYEKELNMLIESGALERGRGFVSYAFSTGT